MPETTPSSTIPVTAPDATAATLGTFGVLLGGVSTITALLISGYWAMGLGAVGLPLSFAARSRSHATGRTGLATTVVVLNILGLALGLSAQLMMLFVMSRS